MPTTNATWLIEATRQFTETDPTLSELLTRTNHTRWPIGHTSCREKTSGSGNWSDHAWGNALDIMRLSKWKDPNDPAKGNAQPGHPHYLDLIFNWLEINQGPFDLRSSQLLWRVKMHYNHIHTSFNHRGTGDPPCHNHSPLHTINPAGGWVLTITPPEEEDEVPQTYKVGEENAFFEPFALRAYRVKTGDDWQGLDSTVIADALGQPDVRTPSQETMDLIYGLAGYPTNSVLYGPGKEATLFTDRANQWEHTHGSDDATGPVIRGAQ